MLTYQRYLVTDDERFNASNYPELLNDLIRIRKGTATMPAAFKTDILISFAKDHCLKMEWLKANTEFAQLVTCGGLPLRNIESLFEACSQNSFFRHQFEDYLKEAFA